MVQFDFQRVNVIGFFLFIFSQLQGITTHAANGDEVRNQNQCGGPLEADSGVLIYPTPGQTVQPGELCVWTINLQNTKAFRFNFTNLNINSSSGCNDGSLRIYSMTNLASTDKLESHTLCNNNPPTGNLFLIENVAAVVFYAGSNPGLETGFFFNWEGTTFNPTPTTHFTNYLTTPSGFIRYPVDGEYEPNTIGTWLVRAGQVDEEISLDFNLTSLSLESCPHVEDPCVCDALILYEISEQGMLTESERFCGERSSAYRGKIAGNFILAFYSDFNSIPNSGNGFEVIYKKSTNDVTTTTTTSTSTTTTEKPTTATPSIPCGTIIDAVVDENWNPAVGKLLYKPSVNYEANERCVWTIRSFPSNQLSMSKMEFTLEQAEFGHVNDKLIVDLLHYRTDSDRPNPHPINGSLVFTKDSVGITKDNFGTVAIVTFTTVSSLGKGFILSYKVSQEECFFGSCSNVTAVDVINADPQGVITQSDETMANYMLATYVVPPANFQFTSSTRTVTLKSTFIEMCIKGCCDTMWVYAFEPKSGLKLIAEICENDPLTVEIQEFESSDMIVFVFKSDEIDVSYGFEISW